MSEEIHRFVTGTVWVARAGARIGVIGGKGKGGYGHRLPAFIPHIAAK
jgi:hypothetical protein